MEFLNGWCRKLVVPLLAVFSLGWVLFFIGFMLYVHDTSARNAFDYIPEILPAAAGPVIVALGFLHAATSGPCSAILGSLTSFLGVFCCMGFGYDIYSISAAVYYSYILKPPSSDFKIFIYTRGWLQVAGSYLASLAWMCVLIAWNCFSYNRKYSQVETIVDEEGNLTERSSSPSRLNKRNVLFAGIARKLALVVLFLLGASWCLYVVGMTEETRSANATTFNNGSLSVPIPFSTWALCVVGLFAILSAIGHAGAYGGASTAMGVFTAILGILFVASVGFIELSLAMEVHHHCYTLNCNSYTAGEIPKYIIYQLSGASGMCVLWACLSALWPFYFKETVNVQNSRRSTRLHDQYMRHQVQEDEDVPLL